MKELVKTLERKDLADHLSLRQLTILFFTAYWCAPCKKMYPVCEKLDEAGNVEVIKIDVSELEQDDELVNDVKVLPTFILYHSGTKVAKVSGAAEEALLDMARKYENWQPKPKASESGESK